MPDTACRRTLVGARTLLRIEEGLKGQGLSVQRAQVQNAFRFGNAGTLESTEDGIAASHSRKEEISDQSSRFCPDKVVKHHCFCPRNFSDNSEG